MTEDLRALERLMDHVDRALAGCADAQERAQLEAHISECDACACEIERAKLLRAILQSSCTQQAPQQLRERIHVVTRQYRSESGDVSYRETNISVRRGDPRV